MINKPLESITIDDLNSLISNQVPEDKTLEYKSELNLDNKDQVKTMLEEISAFANADGGDLIYGIGETNNIASTIRPVTTIHEYEKFTRRISDILQSKIQPRLNSYAFKKVELDGNGTDLAIIIRVQSSSFSPHAVFDGTTHKFHIRKGNSKYPMDVDELRDGFLRTNQLSEKIRNFVIERLSDISIDRYNYLSKDYPIAVINAIPLSHFSKFPSLSVKEINDAIDSFKNDAYGISAFVDGSSKMITFDGIRIYSPYLSESRKAYAFFSNNGTIEYAGNNGFFRNRENMVDGKPPKLIIFIKKLVPILIRSFKEICKYYQSLNITGSVLIFFSILNGYKYRIIKNPDDYEYIENRFIDRDVITLPELFIEDLTILERQSFEIAMKPLLDSLWNASGFEKCYFYDDEGNFTPPY